MTKKDRTGIFVNAALVFAAILIITPCILWARFPPPSPNSISPLETKDGQWLLLFQDGGGQPDYLWLELSEDKSVLEGEGQYYCVKLYLAPTSSGGVNAFFGEVGIDDMKPMIFTAENAAKLWAPWGDGDAIYLLRVAEYQRFKNYPKAEG